LGGAPSGGLGLVGGDAVLLEAAKACGFFGGASSFPSLEVAAALSVLRSASTGHGNCCGVLGALAHRGIATARCADESEVERASGSEEERLQYRE
jgi:hypothetical protein